MWNIILIVKNIKFTGQTAESKLFFTSLLNCLNDFSEYPFTKKTEVHILLNTDHSKDFFQNAPDSGPEQRIFVLKRIFPGSDGPANRVRFINCSNEFELLRDMPGSCANQETVTENLKFCEVKNAKKILFTFDHGNAFGIMKDFPEEKSAYHQLKTKNSEFVSAWPVSKKSRLAIVNNFNTRFEKRKIETRKDGTNIEYISHSENTEQKNLTEVIGPAYLTMDELAGAIKNAIGAVDIIVMCNCFMLCLESCYSLKDITTFLVAPPTGIPFDGYGYSSIFDSLDREEKIENILSAVVFSVEKNVIMTQSTEFLAKMSVFAVDLTQVNSGLFSCFSRLAELLHKAVLNKSLIRINIHPSINYYYVLYRVAVKDLFFLDFRSFLEVMISEMKNSEISQIGLELIELLDKLVVRNDGQRLAYLGEKCRNRPYTSNGVSIYLSPQASSLSDDLFFKLFIRPGSLFQPALYRQTEWDDFNVLYNDIPR